MLISAEPAQQTRRGLDQWDLNPEETEGFIYPKAILKCKPVINELALPLKWFRGEKLSVWFYVLLHVVKHLQHLILFSSF